MDPLEYVRVELEEIEDDEDIEDIVVQDGQDAQGAEDAESAEDNQDAESVEVEDCDQSDSYDGEGGSYDVAIDFGAHHVVEPVAIRDAAVQTDGNPGAAEMHVTPCNINLNFIIDNAQNAAEELGLQPGQVPVHCDEREVREEVIHILQMLRSQLAERFG